MDDVREIIEGIYAAADLSEQQLMNAAKDYMDMMDRTISNAAAAAVIRVGEGAANGTGPLQT